MFKENYGLTQIANFIKSFEGVSLNPYQDVGGIWTIGYGHTGLNGCSPFDIENIKLSTIEDADDILFNDIIFALCEIISQYEHFNKLSLNQAIALTSFVFNVGSENFKKSTLLKKLNDNKIFEIPNEFKKWIYVNGKINHGLIKRRDKEAELWIT